MRRAPILSILLLVVAGCSDGSDTAAGGGSSVSGGSCDPADEDCVCGSCPGVCASDCATDFTTWVCNVPPEPAADQFSCGPWQTVCDAGQACVREVPPGDGCDAYFCAAVPAACAGDVTCECLAPFIDEQPFVDACAGEAGAPTVKVLGPAADPPWDAPDA